MSAETVSTPPRLPSPEVIGTEATLPRVTREEAEEARRHAAEIGDYVTAQRWLWHERLLATQDERDERS